MWREVLFIRDGGFRGQEGYTIFFWGGSIGCMASTLGPEVTEILVSCSAFLNLYTPRSDVGPYFSFQSVVWGFEVLQPTSN